MLSRLALCFALTLVCLSPLQGQATAPAPQAVKPPKAVYTPAPVYRPEWAKQGLAGKGMVLVTIDPRTGNVTGARMEQSTGNQQLDGAALAAYSQWRFEPGSVPAVKMPIEFRAGPPPAPSARQSASSPTSYIVVLIAGFAAAMMFMRMRRRA